MARKIGFLLILIVELVFSVQLSAQKVEPIVVSVEKPIAPIQSTMWGIFFEDINFAADGGLYAELVKNRSFEFAKPLLGWKIVKADATEGLLVLNRGESETNNPRYVRISRTNAEEKFGLENEGFRGMGIKKGMKYHFSLLARIQTGPSMKIRLELIGGEGAVIGSAEVVPGPGDWKRYQVDFTSVEGDPLTFR